MARLIDTGVLIELERRGQPLDQVPLLWRNEPMAVASITVSELLLGVHRAVPGRRQADRRAFVEWVIDTAEVLPFDLLSARIHAEIVAHLLRLGQPVGVNDTLIAAIALAHGHSVLTTNAKDFDRIEGLVVERPVWPD